MVIDIDDEEAVESGYAGAPQVATPGNAISGGGAASAFTPVACLPIARSA